MATPPQPQLDLTSLDGTVQFFRQHGIANSSQKTYKSALRRFANFGEIFNVLSHFPVSEAILCYFVSFLANQKLSPQTITFFLAGICHMQIKLGLPEPREFSSLPRLRLVQAGIQWVHAQVAAASTRICLPFTPTVLQQMQNFWSRKSHGDPDIVMLWAAGNISIDNQAPSGYTSDNLRQTSWEEGCKYMNRRCIVPATAYMASRGNKMGPFFQQKKAIHQQNMLYSSCSCSIASGGTAI